MEVIEHGKILCLFLTMDLNFSIGMRIEWDFHNNQIVHDELLLLIQEKERL